MIVRRNLTPGACHGILWHELTHALQCERNHGGSWTRMIAAAVVQHTAAGIFGVEPGREMPLDEWLARYTNMPAEREAYRMQALAERGQLPVLLSDLTPADPTCIVSKP